MKASSPNELNLVLGIDSGPDEDTIYTLVRDLDGALFVSRLYMPHGPFAWGRPGGRIDPYEFANHSLNGMSLGVLVQQKLAAIDARASNVSPLAA